MREGDAVWEARYCTMNPHRTSLGSKRPREECADKPEGAHHRPGCPPASVGAVCDAAEHELEHEHNSPARHTPGVTPGASLSENSW